MYTVTPQFLNMCFSIMLISTPELPVVCHSDLQKNIVRWPVSNFMRATYPCHLLLIFSLAVFDEEYKIINFCCACVVFSPAFLLDTNIRQIDVCICNSNNIPSLHNLHKMHVHVLIRFTHSMKMVS